jgi:pyruvate/2-oxoglutarate dehydrogenase complex dihydrolipoamide dehydrogenase (E3) component
MKFDAIVIGSGQGGNPLAQRLAGLKHKVALIEERHLGGTCINTGCTPTKTMVASAQVAHYARSGARWGVNTSEVSVDLGSVLARKNKVVESWRSGQEKRDKALESLHLFREHAEFAGPRQVKVGGETLESDHIFIDTGARPAIPRISGLENIPYLTNESILELSNLPDHLVVLGGGYIGLEFAQMFRRFGSKVTVVHNSGQILSHEDEDIASELKKALEAEGIDFLLDAEAQQIEKRDNGLTLTYRHAGGSQTVTGSLLLVATGRTPNTDSLNLGKAGVETDNKGFIKVNGRLETSAPGIWAIGDVKGGPAFTHISYNDFQVIYGNLIEGKNLSIEHRIVPYGVFTDPQLGGIGMTEREARAKGYRLKMGTLPVTSVARAIERGETAGLMKIVIDAANDQILGASILAAEGAEIVQIFTPTMLAKQPYTLLKGAIYIHPTMAEGFFSLLEAVKEVV